MLLLLRLLRLLLLLPRLASVPRFWLLPERLSTMRSCPARW